MRLTKFINLLLLLISIIFYQANAFSIKLTPIDSPQLHLVPKDLTTNERTQLRIDISVSRAFYANKRNANRSPNSISSRLYFGTGFYVTELFVGTGKSAYSRYLLFDISSGLTWFQCGGCDPCFDISSGNVKAEDSTTYIVLSPNDKRCLPKYTYKGSCGFNYSETAGKGYTEGYLGTDTFRFSDPRNRTQFSSNVAFGCGMNNYNYTWKDDNAVAGFLGLGPGQNSLLVQLAPQIKNRFSYCVPTWEDPDAASTIIAFGDDAQIKGDDARRVQQIRMNFQARYHLYLAGITLDGKRLPIDPSFWQLDDKDYTKGFFIDPGVPFTLLSEIPYTVLRDSMVKYFSKYKLEPGPSISGFDLCFPTDLDEEAGQRYPTLALNFVKSFDESGEVDHLLDQSNVFIKPGGYIGFCMAIQPIGGPGPCFFGAYQQANWQFLFDVANDQLSFLSKTCKD